MSIHEDFTKAGITGPVTIELTKVDYEIVRNEARKEMGKHSYAFELPENDKMRTQNAFLAIKNGINVYFINRDK